MLREYGIDTFSAFMREMRENTTAALRRRLLELPDGRWADETYIDHDGQSPDATYRIHCVMTKTGDRLAFDFAGLPTDLRPARSTPQSGVSPEASTRGS